jgi:hypothetical protein
MTVQPPWKLAQRLFPTSSDFQSIVRSISLRHLTTSIENGWTISYLPFIWRDFGAQTAGDKVEGKVCAEEKEDVPSFRTTLVGTSAAMGGKPSGRIFPQNISPFRQT